MARRRMSRVVIAGGTGTLGQQLARTLAPAHEVLGVGPGSALPAPEERLAWRTADLTAIPEAEVAFAGAQVVVMLAQARRPPARLTRAALGDLDALLADAVARAAQRCGVQHLVHFACGDDDGREALLRRGAVPVTVLRGGGPDPVARLAALVEAPPGGPDVVAPGWSGAPAVEGPREGLWTCSVQRYARPAGWVALDVARAYFRWLPSAVPGVRTEASGHVFTVHAGGVRALVLRLVPGRSEADSAWLEVADGALVERAEVPGRLEFRVLLDGSACLAALVGYRPSLPWTTYRFTQAPAHERVMRQFGDWLSTQRGPPPEW